MGLPVFSNAFGTLYHPMAIHRLIDLSLNATEIPETTFVERFPGQFSSFYTHGSINANSPDQLKQLLKQKQETFKNNISKAKVLFITWGSAWAYHHFEHLFLCANCHRQAHHNFNKSLTDVNELVQSAIATLRLLKHFNPNLRVVITISPVKHLKDGLRNNLISKSVLHLAVHQLQNQMSEIYYFPSFEYIQEDLRDYRFYNMDLAHPNHAALEYVWDKFKSTFYTKESLQLITLLESYSALKAHNPMQVPELHAASIDRLIKKINALLPDWNPFPY